MQRMSLIHIFHEHVAAFAVVADGVFHQVVDHLLEQGLVALDSNWFRLEVHLHIGIGGQLGQTSHDAFRCV